MAVSLSDFRAISSGTHNMGEVRIAQGGELEKINNHVSGWHKSENNVITTVSENRRVRQELYKLIASDGRASQETLLGIKRTLLGDGLVCSLKRDEIAAYLSAMDRDDAKGLSERVAELRGRTGTKADIGSVRLLKSGNANAAELSRNELVDRAYMKIKDGRSEAYKDIQKARVHLDIVIYGKGQREAHLAPLVDNFYKAVKGLLADRFPTTGNVVDPDTGEYVSAEEFLQGKKAALVHQIAAAVNEHPNQAGLRAAIVDILSAALSKELQSYFRDNTLTNEQLGQLSQRMQDDVMSVLKVKLDSEDAIGVLSTETIRELTDFCRGDKDMVGKVSGYSTLLHSARMSIAGTHYDQDGSAKFNEDLVKEFTTQFDSTVKKSMVNEGPMAKDGMTSGMKTVRGYLQDDLNRGASLKIVVPGMDEQVSNLEKLDTAVAQMIHENMIDGNQAQVVKRFLCAFAQQSSCASVLNAMATSGEPFSNGFSIGTLDRQNFVLTQNSDKSFTLVGDLVGKIRMAANGKGQMLPLSVMSRDATVFEAKFNLRLSFGEGDKPVISLDSSHLKVEVPDTMTTVSLDSESIDNTEEAMNFLQGRAADIDRLITCVPLGNEDRKDFIDEANKILRVLTDNEHLFPAEARVQEKIDVIMARCRQVEQLRIGKPATYRNVLKTIRQWCKAADFVYEQELMMKGDELRNRNRPIPERLNPQNRIKAELFMSLPDFDDVQDLDAECPDVGRHLKKIQDKLAAKLSKALKFHGIDQGESYLAKMLEFGHEVVLNREPWKTIAKDIRLNVGGQDVKAQSILTPAKQLPNFAQIHPYENGVNGYCSSARQPEHAVNLFASEYKLNGKTVFRGVRHGVAMRKHVKEVLTAAILSNPELLRRLTDDNRPDKSVVLTSTSLLTPDIVRGLLKKGSNSDERQMLDEQVEAWNALVRESRENGGVELMLPDPDNPGGFKNCRVDVSVMAFNFGVNYGGVSWLSDAAGGWDKSDPLNAESWRNMKQLVERRLANMPKDAPHYSAMRTLVGQVDLILKYHFERIDCHDAYKAVARINVLSYLMGWVPAWNCKSGKDRTGELDVETKFLMTLIETGQPIPRLAVELDEPNKEVLLTIALQGGNHEVQQYNTGVGGFKLKGVASIPERLGGKQAAGEHLGLSKYAHS